MVYSTTFAYSCTASSICILACRRTAGTQHPTAMRTNRGDGPLLSVGCVPSCLSVCLPSVSSALPLLYAAVCVLFGVPYACSLAGYNHDHIHSDTEEIA
jgi:hypothetical protein